MLGSTDDIIGCYKLVSVILGGPLSEGIRVRGTAGVALVPLVDVAVALVCGVVASDRFVWSGIQLLRIWIVWLIADIVLGLVFDQWRVLKEVNLQDTLEGGGDGSLSLFPYAMSNSPGAQVSRAMDEFISQWEVVWPLVGRAALTAILGAVLALAMATFLGREILAIVAFGLIFGVGLVVTCNEREILSRWLCFLRLSLAWVLGAGALGPLALPTMGLALLMGLGAYGREGLGTEGRWRFIRLLRVTNWSLVFILLLSQQPVLAIVVVIASLAESTSRGYQSSEIEKSLLYKIPWFAGALTTALAVTRW